MSLPFSGGPGSDSICKGTSTGAQVGWPNEAVHVTAARLRIYSGFQLNESQWWCRYLACMAGNAAKMAAPPGHKDAPE